ncbi:hypothetical protein Lal_00011598 [Lupinus albus]|nr:hypothetical protein Lal_00011598 [Lupinus albus]
MLGPSPTRPDGGGVRTRNVEMDNGGGHEMRQKIYKTLPNTVKNQGSALDLGVLCPFTESPPIHKEMTSADSINQ